MEGYGRLSTLQNIVTDLTHVLSSKWKDFQKWQKRLILGHFANFGGEFSNVGITSLVSINAENSWRKDFIFEK